MTNIKRARSAGDSWTRREPGVLALLLGTVLFASACAKSTPFAADAPSAAVSGSAQAAGRVGDALAFTGTGANPSGRGAADGLAAVGGESGGGAPAAGNGAAAAAVSGKTAAGLAPHSECVCSGSGYKVAIDPVTARANQTPDAIVLKFVDGARTLPLDAAIGFQGRERSAQDLAELACAKLDADAADTALAALNTVLAASPSLAIEPQFSGDTTSLDAKRDFDGRHCASAGGEALADLSNYYLLHIMKSDGPRLMRAFDESAVVQTAYYEPLPAPPP